MNLRTPGPWAVQPLDTYGGPGLTITGGADEVLVATIGLPFDAEDSANFAFIVTACNAHDDLVAALNECSEWLESFYDEGADRLAPTLARARAALAKAQS